MVKLTAIAAAALASAFLAAPAVAGLDGAQLKGEYYFPTLSNPYPLAFEIPSEFVVGKGVETMININLTHNLFFDFYDTGLNISSNFFFHDHDFLNAPFNGVVFSGAELSNITGVQLLSGTSVTDFDLSRVTFAGDKLKINFADLEYDRKGKIQLGFTFGAGAVPEPATWAMLIAGFGMVGVAARRRKVTTARAIAA